jgi:hypothetical protein
MDWKVSNSTASRLTMVYIGSHEDLSVSDNRRMRPTELEKDRIVRLMGFEWEYAVFYPLTSVSVFRSRKYMSAGYR